MRIIAALLLTSIALVASAQETVDAQATPSSLDPFALYGSDIAFDILRNGKRVGDHRVTFQRDGERLIVTNRMTIAIEILFVTAYRFSYEAVETWAGGRLESLDVHTNDDGTKTVVTARAEGAGLRISGLKGSYVSARPLLPTTHWNTAQPTQDQVLNTLDGKTDPGPAARLGIDVVNLPHASIQAEHFEYTGELKGTETWYDPNGRWVKLRFKGRDGSVIEYRCVRCGPGA